MSKARRGSGRKQNEAYFKRDREEKGNKAGEGFMGGLHCSLNKALAWETRDWVQNPGCHTPCYVTLGKSHNLSVSVFPLCKVQ